MFRDETKTWKRFHCADILTSFCPIVDCKGTIDEAAEVSNLLLQKKKKPFQIAFLNTIAPDVTLQGQGEAQTHPIVVLSTLCCSQVWALKHLTCLDQAFLTQAHDEVASIAFPVEEHCRKTKRLQLDK